MYDISISLEQLHCNQESDRGGAEPYLWTLFFYLDMNTQLIETYTPLRNATTRGMYPGNVHAGDDVLISPSLGRFEVSLDDGGMGRMYFGFIGVLFDQDSTPGAAIRAGHQVFAESADTHLKALIVELFLSGDNCTP